MRTDPARDGGQAPIKPTVKHHLQRAETRSGGHQTRHTNTLAAPKNSIKVTNRIDDKRATLAESNPPTSECCHLDRHRPHCRRNTGQPPQSQPRQSRQSDCSLKCLGARCIFENLYAWTWCSLWKICDEQRTLLRFNLILIQGLQKGWIRWTGVWAVGTDHNHNPFAHPKTDGGYPLIHRGKHQRTGTEPGDIKNRHPCQLPLTFGNSGVEDSPTTFEKAISTALAVRRGEANYI